MKTASAKAKGRRLQQFVAKRIREELRLPESDVKSLPMGSQGADVWLSANASEKFPFIIECKNQEKINIWAAHLQALEHSKNGRGVQEASALVVFSKNNSPVLCCLCFEDLLALARKASRYDEIKLQGSGGLL